MVSLWLLVFWWGWSWCHSNRQFVGLLTRCVRNRRHWWHPPNITGQSWSRRAGTELAVSLWIGCHTVGWPQPVEEEWCSGVSPLICFTNLVNCVTVSVIMELELSKSLTPVCSRNGGMDLFQRRHWMPIACLVPFYVLCCQSGHCLFWWPCSCWLQPQCSPAVFGA